MKERIRTVSRRHLADRIAHRKRIPAKEAELWVALVLDAVRELLMSADPEIRIELRDFGVFEVKIAREKPRARNPRTGDEIYVPAHRKTHFKPSKRLKTFLSIPVEPSGEPRPRR
jgi:integration host factor subunit beta